MFDRLLFYFHRRIFSQCNIHLTKSLTYENLSPNDEFLAMDNAAYIDTPYYFVNLKSLDDNTFIYDL